MQMKKFINEIGLSPGFNVERSILCWHKEKINENDNLSHYTYQIFLTIMMKVDAIFLYIISYEQTDNNNNKIK
jgi:hypothetical protein